ncbi:DUF4390 domain-containing protein [Desulfobacterales bacterium HSG2]|nr:DUF4390 domain-containing protein [Desulfobacterales bacterium HSG2]
MKRKISIILLGILFLTQNPAFAKKARLGDITITNTYDGLELAYLNVKGTFTAEMRKAVLSGVPTTFLFFVTVYKVRRFWSDNQIADIQITHTIKYHNLKKEFVIRRSWEKNKPITVKSFKEARKLMSEISHLKIVPSDKLEKGTRYQLRAKAKLGKVTLPLYLHYILMFVSLWDFETDWHTIDFVY